MDLGTLQTSGVKGLLYRYLRDKEKILYALSDNIGFMSQANVDYILNEAYSGNCPSACGSMSQ